MNDRSIVAVSDLLEEMDLPAVIGLCGGWGLDFFIGHQTRPHENVDLSIHADETYILEQWCQSEGMTWERKERSFPPTDGSPLRWTKAYIDVQPKGGWKQLGRIRFWPYAPSSARWVFEKDDSIWVNGSRELILSKVKPWVVQAPEIILFYKALESNSSRNEHDFQETWKILGSTAKKWLLRSVKKLAPEHTWLVSAE